MLFDGNGNGEWGRQRSRAISLALDFIDQRVLEVGERGGHDDLHPTVYSQSLPQFKRHPSSPRKPSFHRH